MPSANPSEKIADISKELETLRAQSLSHPEKAAEILQDGLEQLQVSLKELTTLVGGMTDAERAEEALRESEARLRRIAKAGRIGLFEWNASKDTAYWSPEHYELFGYEPGSTISWQRWLQGVHPEDHDRVVANAGRLLERTRSEGQVQGHKDEYRFIRPDGSVMWLRADLSAYMVGGETIIRGSVSDITERKHMEDELQDLNEKREQSLIERSKELESIRKSLTEQSRYLEAFFRHSITPIVFLDRDFNFILVNDAYAKACKKEVGDFPGHNHFEFYPSDAKAIFDEVVRTKKPIKVVARPFKFPDHPDWGVTYWDWMLTPLLDDRGDVEFLVFSLEDVTIRKRAEMELEKYRKGLEDLVRDRTCELEYTNNQLQAEIAERKHLEEIAKIEEKRLRSIIKVSQYNPKSIRELLDYALDEAIALSESKLGYILYYSEETQKFTLHAWSKEAMKECSIPHPPTVFQLGNTGVWGEVVRQRRPIVINDFQAPDPLKRGYPLGHAHLTRFMSVPVFIDNRIVAVVAVANKSSDYSDQDSSQLSMMIESLWTIAERKRIEEELKESEMRLQAVIDNLPIGIWFADGSGKILFGNEAGQKIWSGAKYVGPEEFHEYKAWWADTGLPLGPEDWAVVRAVRKGEISLNEVLDIECFDGTRKTIRNSAVPLRSPDGQIFGVVVLNEDITERKRAEKALRESEERLRSLAENAPCVLMRFDRQLRIVYLSKQSDQYNPNLVERMIGRTNREMGMPEHLCDLWDAAIERVFSTGNQEEMEFDFAGPSGMRTFALKFAPEFGPDHEVQYVLGVSSDITDRKKAEKELKASEARYRGLFENLHEPVTIHRCILNQAEEVIDWTYEDANPSALKALRKSKEEIVGKRFSDLFGPGIREKYINRIREVRQKNGGIIYEDHFEPIDQYFYSSLIPLNDDRFIFSSIDITNIKRAERSLQESEERLALAISAGRLATWDRLMTTDEVVWNDEHFRMMGYEPGEVNPSYQAWAERVHPDDRSNAEVAFTRSLEVGGDFSTEFRVLWPDGTVRWIEARGHLDRGAAGQPIRSFGVMIDITERKEAEKQLTNAKMLLEQKVKERTAELLKAKEAAEAAAKAKSDFLANMSHEIRTPMNAILGFTELMLDEPMDPVQRENLQLVRTNGDALLSIINDILDFSKMESDKVVLEEHEFDLRQCVEEALDLVALRASDKDLNLAYTIDKNVPENIIGDLGRLRQVLGNLLSNSVKFTDEGDVILSVSSQETDGEKEIHFAVQDTGIGIPQGSMNQLFQSFNQMEPSTSRLYGGTGLGLSISKKLVELMGGKIWAESEEGKGSTFHFTIKAASGQHQLQNMAVLPQMIGKHVLIIEDNKTNRRILSKQVYDWGMIPVAVASGQEALKYIRRGDNFDIAIMDMDLNDISGRDLEEEIRKYNKTLPLVLLTSLGKKIPPNHAYLTKPIKPSQLHKVLTDILPREPTRRPVQQVLASQTTQSHALKILLAEDNISHQKVAQQMLRKLGYKADIAANGIEALHALERQHYDVIFMDVKMPVMDGLEATRIIRQRWPQGPKIIAITAFDLRGDREKFISAGMDDYISKPVQKDDLEKVLMKCR